MGAFIVNGAKSWLTVTFPEFWLYFLGALFIAVTLWLPQGVVGLVKKLRGNGKGASGMTPDLMEAGAQRLEARGLAPLAGQTESGGRSASYGRVHTPGEVDTTHGRILYLEDVHVSFDGFKAINGLSLDIAPGELRCIIGPNGAGKTTMMDIITGKTRPDAGQVFFGSTIDLLRYREAEIASLGIGRKFQKPTVFEQLSVFENLELALATDKRVRRSMVFALTGEEKDRLSEVLADHPPGRQRGAPGRQSEPRSEAMAGDRHVADAGPQAAVARRAGGGHDR